MNPILKNIIAVVVGLIVGSIVNMLIVSVIGPALVPLPEGVDPNDMESLKAAMPDFGFEQFISPFLAHALGTLSGAFLAATIAATHKMRFAIAIGAFFLLGGIAAAVMLPAPMWFEAFDIIVAYLPMGFLGGYFAGGNRE